MSKKKVLLVEDSRIAQIVGRSILEKNGYEVDIAETGERAVEYCLHHRYYLVFMDIGLPGMDGINTTMKIRRTENPNQNVPIVALTAHIDDNLKSRGFQAGMNDYLVKPLTLQSAEEILKKYDRKSIIDTEQNPSRMRR